jgi:hypothetical protein
LNGFIARIPCVRFFVCQAIDLSDYPSLARLGASDFDDAGITGGIA